MALSLPPPHVGRMSSSSGRAMQSSKDRRVPAEVGDVLDQVEEGRLAPVQVVEDHHDRPLGRPSLEQLAKGPRDLLRGASGGVVAEDRGERTDRLAGRDELLHDLGDRPVGDAFAVGETAAADDRRVDAAEELLRESRLADARGAEDREEVARAVAGDAGERRPRAARAAARGRSSARRDDGRGPRAARRPAGRRRGARTCPSPRPAAPTRPRRRRERAGRSPRRAAPRPAGPPARAARRR